MSNMSLTYSSDTEYSAKTFSSRHNFNTVDVVRQILSYRLKAAMQFALYMLEYVLVGDQFYIMEFTKASRPCRIMHTCAKLIATPHVG